MDAAEFGEWIAYDRIDPLGDDRGDLHAALVAYTIACVMGGKPKPRLTDFIPRFDARPETDWTAIEKQLAAYAAAVGKVAAKRTD